jgi:hypothetical protein
MNNRIWSLWDMLQLKSVAFIRALIGIANINGGLVAMKTAVTFKDSDPIACEQIRLVREETDILIEVLQELEAPTALKGARRLAEGLTNPNLNFSSFSFLMAHTVLSLKDEFGAHLFLTLSSNEARLFRIAEPPFGQQVQDKFPAAISEDIAEASKCLACARYTASVFHLMRVMEAGVQGFADMLNVPLVQLPSGKSKVWQLILNDTKAAIDKLPQHDAKTKKYSEISANLYHVKVAWRNEVMHPKQTYTEEQASEVFAASKAFMRELASVL